MQQTWLITGPPGCGKTNWIRETLLNHGGACAYLRLDGATHEELGLGHNAGIDQAG
jgi:broad-specificity NMP kinase